MPRQTTFVNFYKNINLSRDYSNVCDAISIPRLSPYLVWTSSELSVIRHNSRTGSFKINKTIDELSYINYMALYNNAGDRSPIFAFLTDLNYITDSVTEVFFEVDLFSTYCQTMDYQDCFITRMTTSDDTLYKYLEPEPVGGLDYVVNKVDQEFQTSWHYGFSAVVSPNGAAVPGHLRDNFFTMAATHTYSDVTAISDAIEEYVTNGLVDDICDVFQYPGDCPGGDFRHFTKAVYWNDRIDSYTNIKNNKLFSYPFRRALIVDSDGQSLEVKPELTTDNQIKYTLDKAAFPIPNITLTLDEYDQNSYVNEKANRITLSGFPQVVWSSDTYKAWLARNKPSIDAQKAQVAANVVGGALIAATGALNPEAVTKGAMIATGVSNVMSGVNKAYNLYTQEEQQKLAPRTIHKGGNLTTDVATAHFGFVIQQESVNARQAALIDNFFNAYGYAINKVDYFSPSRERFDYVETKGELFRRESEGNGIPNVALETMNAAANRGLRIWHSISELNRRDLVSTNAIV